MILLFKIISKGKNVSHLVAFSLGNVSHLAAFSLGNASHLAAFSLGNVSHLAAFSLGKTPLSISLAMSDNDEFFRCCLTTLVT
jgi:hypothetical protein